MAITKKLLHFKTKANFEKELAAGNILDTSIVFIKDANEIWTHGTYYATGANSVLVIENGVTKWDDFYEAVTKQDRTLVLKGSSGTYLYLLRAKVITENSLVQAITVGTTANVTSASNFTPTITITNFSKNGNLLSQTTVVPATNILLETNKGAADGVVPLDSNRLINPAYLPEVTTSNKGAMTKEDKAALDAIPTTYLPLSAGTDKPLTGTLQANKGILSKDAITVESGSDSVLKRKITGESTDQTLIRSTIDSTTFGDDSVNITLRSKGDLQHTIVSSGGISTVPIWDKANLPTPASTTDLNNYLPLSAGSTKRLIDSLYLGTGLHIYADMSTGNPKHLVGILPDSGTVQVGSSDQPLSLYTKTEDVYHAKSSGNYKMWDAYNLPNPLTTTNFDISEMLAYGVEWDVTVSNPDCTRIGNLSMHKSLPIQSELKGCVAKGKEIQYYLNPNDWSLKEDGTPSVLDGTDGEVKIHVPRFYGKSGANGNKRWVKISTMQIDDSWIEIPEMLIDAYRCTVNTTDSATPKTASVVNNTAEYRGGGNRSDGDSETQFRTDLGKPRTNLTRATMRTYIANKADGSALFNYEYYKWVMYWLPVIEYATFNSQKAYNAELTSEGYRQGGLGAGLTNWDSYKWIAFTSYYPITPCGYTNEFGNFSGIKELPAQTFEYKTTAANSISSYYSSTNASLVTKSISGSTCTITKSTQAASFIYVGFVYQTGATVYTISGLQDGQGLKFTGGGVNQTVTENGDVTINWSTTDLSTRYIQTTFAGTCNITLTLKSSSSETITVTTAVSQINRYRGFENIFGDIWTNLDGIIIDANAGDDNLNKVYTSTNPGDYNDSDYSTYRLAGHEIHTEGYTKTFDLQDTAEIIPSAVGGSSTTYKCNYHYVGGINTTLRTLLVGGRANDGGYAGLGSFDSIISVSYSNANVGFRTYVLV